MNRYRALRFWCLMSVCALAPALSATTITVSSLSDSGPGTLRAAITSFNAGNCNQCVIAFSVAGEINLASPLPAITNGGLTIDGYTAPGASPNTNGFGQADNASITVAINGQGTVGTGFEVQGNNVTIRGMGIHGFVSGGNGQGVYASGSGSLTLLGNFIGTDNSGSFAMANDRGVVINGVGAHAIIGGSAPADRNVISGNSVAGVLTLANAVNMRLLGNYVGVNAADSAAVPNGVGVLLQSHNHRIGDTTIGNVISGNATYGIQTTFGSHVITRCFIGTNASGTAIPNGSGGIYGSGSNGLSGSTIGGATAADGNVISGNGGFGIRIEGNSADTFVSNNRIGVASNGVNALPNNGDGIVIAGGSRVFAADAPGHGNTIAYNTSKAIDVLSGTRNVFRGNAIFGNGGTIDLGGDGATANDAGDADSGANNLQNWPSVDAVTLYTTRLEIVTSIDSSAAAGTASLTIDAYRADGSLQPQGMTWLGSSGCVAGNALAGYVFNIAPPPAGLGAGDKVILTATAYADGVCGTINDGTSEFSGTTPVVACTPPPVSISATASRICAGTSVTLDAGAGFASYNWSTGETTQTITVSPSSTTNYSVTVLSTLGCTNTAATSILVDAPPVPSITPAGPTTFCSGGSVTLNATSSGSLQWMLDGNAIGGATSASYVASAPGSYMVVATNGVCVVTSSPVTVTVNSYPDATVIASAVACSNGSGSATVPAAAGATYSWSITNGTITSGNGTNSVAFAAGASGNVSISVDVTTNGCTSHGSASVPIDALTASINAGGPTTFCDGGSVVLAAPAAASYQWLNGTTPIGGANASTYTATASGSYSVTIADANGCSATSPATVVTVNPIPAANVVAPVSVCAAGSSSASVAAQPGATYAWTISGGTITAGQGTDTVSFTAGNSGAVTFGVTVTLNGCVSSGSAQTAIGSFTPSIAAGGPTTFCDGGSVTLTATTASSYQWFLNGQPTGQTSQSIVVSSAGSYSVSAASGGCSGTSSAVGVTVLPQPVATISAAPAVDAASTRNVASVPQGPAGTTYAWTIQNGTIVGGNGTPAIEWTASTQSPITISVVATTGACSATSSVTVGINGQADLGVSLTAPAKVDPASAVTIVVNPTNLGPSDAATALISVDLPLTFTVNGVSTSPFWNCNTVPGHVTCSAGLSPVGTLAPITINATAASTPGPYSVSASILSGTSDTDHVNDAATAQIAVRDLNGGGGPGCSTDAPQLLAPAMHEALRSPITFTWKPVDGAESYTLWLTPGEEGAPQDIVRLPGTQTTVTVPLPRGNYSWVIEALFDGCPATQPSKGKFTVFEDDACANRPLATLLEPAPGVTTLGSRITFEWLPISNASGYRVWVSVDGSPFASLGTTQASTLTGFIGRGKVEWYVETLYDGCASTESTHAPFNVPSSNACGSDVPTLLSPADNTSNSGTDVELRWSAVPDAVSYEVWVALSGDSATLVGTTDTTSMRRNLPAGAFDWYVRAVVAGCDPRESQHARFVHTLPEGCGTQRPVLALPVDDARTVVSPVDFAWSSVPGATAYELWVSVNHFPPVRLATVDGTRLERQAIGIGPAEWYVVALFPNCAPMASTPNTFTVIKKPECGTLDMPSLRVPGEVSSGVRYHVRWSNAGAATLYEVQESENAQFGGAQLFSSQTPEIDFRHTNEGTTPVRYYYRVRAVSSCSGANTLYSDVAAVTILPAGSTSPLRGATPADDRQTVHNSLHIGGSGAPGVVAAAAGDSFTATADVPWITVTPSSGTLGADGVTLDVASDPAALPFGMSSGNVVVTFGTASSTASGSKRPLDNNKPPATTPVTVNVVQPVATAAKNTPAPDSLIFPAVAHASGAAATYQSDVRITNTSPQVMKYQITFTPSGEDGFTQSRTSSINVEPGRTAALNDILQSWFAVTGLVPSSAGALEVRPLTATTTSTSGAARVGLPNAVTFAASRLYSVLGSGTFGQFIPPVPYVNFIARAPEGSTPSILTLQQTAQSDAYHTNLGLIEGSGDAANILLRVYNDAGEKVGEFAQPLKGGQNLQLNSTLAAHNLSLNDGRIEATVSNGNGKITTYASVVDNSTGDSLLVSAVAVRQLGATKYVVPGAAQITSDTANWHTDLRIFNAGDDPVKTTVSYYPQDDSGPVTKEITVGAKEVKSYDAVLSSLFGLDSGAGAIQIATAGTSSLVATARTYNRTSAGGTYGQFVPAATLAESAGKESRSLQLLQLEESAQFRTNLGIAEMSGNPAKVELTIIPPDGKVAASTQIDLPANGFRQFSQVLKSAGFDSTYNMRVSARVISGNGRITAYASVIDKTTGDPTYIPAQ